MDWKEKLRQLKNQVVGSENNTQRTPSSSAGGPQATQTTAPARTPRAERRYVCLGLDFGTSSTKAVIRVQPIGPAYAVPFGDLAPNDQPYLAPTRLWVARSGDLSLRKSGDGGWVEHLKVRLMERPWEAAPAYEGDTTNARSIDLVAGYLALTLRKIFAWFGSGVRGSLGQVEVLWAMNMGMPARDWDAKEIHSAFLIAARAGWHLAMEGRDIDLAHIALTVDAATNDGFLINGIESELIKVVPEVAAGVTTYVRSQQKQLGPHLFVDVGATTLDSSFFMLGQGEDGHEFHCLSADVDSKLGAFRLHEYRAESLSQLALDKFAASDPLTPIPVSARDCIPLPNEVDRIDTLFSEKCIDKIRRVVVQARNMAPADLNVPEMRGLPRPSEVEQGFIRVLLSGGGIQLPLYQIAIGETGRRVAPGGGLGIRVKPLRNTPVPQPSDLQASNLNAGAWDRLVVAYGLSFAFDDIGRFVPPSQITPIAQPRQADRPDPIGPEQM